METTFCDCKGMAQISTSSNMSGHGVGLLGLRTPRPTTPRGPLITWTLVATDSPLAKSHNKTMEVGLVGLGVLRPRQTLLLLEDMEICAIALQSQRAISIILLCNLASDESVATRVQVMGGPLSYSSSPASFWWSFCRNQGATVSCEGGSS
jgi:hypothetical protein